ncbi:MAG TPA: hypothetical protein PK093_09015 [Phycisphaerae bacterium]|nr:hypothetical protein [Phycisphaerae bacterium]
MERTRRLLKMPVLWGVGFGVVFSMLFFSQSMSGGVVVGQSEPTDSSDGLIQRFERHQGLVPVGAIVAWHKRDVSRLVRENSKRPDWTWAGLPKIGDLPTDFGEGPYNLPFELLDGSVWVECNGQTLDDKSPYDEWRSYRVPGLNGAGSSGRFLRGGHESGDLQDGTLLHANAERIAPEGAYFSNVDPVDRKYWSKHSVRVDDCREEKPIGRVRPVNMAVVWIMRLR